MALAAVHTVMTTGENKPVHPFFSKTPRADLEKQHGDHGHLDDAVSSRSSNSPANVEPLNNLEYLPNPSHARPEDNPGPLDTDQTAARRKRRKLDTNETGDRPSGAAEAHSEPHEVGSESISTGPRVDTKGIISTSTTSSSSKAFESSSPYNDPIPTSLDAPVGISSTSNRHGIETAKADLALPNPALNPPHPKDDPNKQIETEKSEAGIIQTAANPPSKMLMLDGSGRFLLPGPPKHKELDDRGDDKQKGRKRKKTAKNYVITIRYGNDQSERREIGSKIDSILEGHVTTAAHIQPESSSKVPTNSNDPAKPTIKTHPFFNTKRSSKESREKERQEPHDTGDQKRPLASIFSKPGNPAENCEHGLTSFTAQRNPANPRFMTASQNSSKHAGISNAPWPWSGIVHVRPTGTDSDVDVTASKHGLSDKRKRKGRKTDISATENIIGLFSIQLKAAVPEDGQGPDTNTLPKYLRIPQRLLTTDYTIKQCVRKELSRSLDDLDDVGKDELSVDIHPSLVTLWRDIGRNLTPFDLGKCETQSWTQKYSPKCAEHVLQRGREAMILRDWLQSLTILAVEGAQKEHSKPDVPKKRKKKAKRKDGLDDFVVSDDASDVMDELSDREGFSPRVDRMQKRSVVRATGSSNGPGARKAKNAVLISGPNGCGKSAAVFAVAKELGFEVFEINSGSRRSGRDVLDKVGDMAENHLVSHQQHVCAEPTPLVDSDTEQMDATLQQDLESGRQGMMTSFFKPKAVPKKGRPPKPKTSAPVQKDRARPQKQQKQSLILLEEVDVLFEEDKQFWSTVVSLAVQSKRPIIMTCNDESLVPQDEISFHAILRFTPPPETLATDYMLIIAATEGHLLRRAAVQSLYRSRNRDLRASIAELDFWCQMAVGDRKGGLEWIYQRWPPGKDVDENGRILRVASQDTYRSGMGWYSRDAICASAAELPTRNEEALAELWEAWEIVPEQGLGATTNLAQSIASSSSVTTHDRLQALKNIEYASEGVSSADVYCKIGLPSPHYPILDPTQPSIPEKSRQSFASGHALIQADEAIDYTGFDFEIAIATQLAAHQLRGHNKTKTNDDTTSSSFLCEADVISTICKHKAHQLTTTTFHPSKIVDICAPIASNSHPTLMAPSIPLTQLDRPLSIVVAELAPYVRIMALYDVRLARRRIKLSGLLSEGGHQAKRQRTTRASRSALEGSTRKGTRRDKWFGDDLNLRAVLSTAGGSWAGLGAEDIQEVLETSGVSASEMQTTEGSETDE